MNKIRGKLLVGRLEQIQSNDLIMSEIATKKTSLTAAQIKALYATPLSLVAAPGAGKIIVPIEIFAKYTFGTTAFTGSNALEFRYTSNNGAKFSTDINASFLLSASGTNYRSMKALHTELVPVVNAPLTISVPSADPAQGLGVLEVSVAYRVITI
jgi:hypothetical protein